MPNVNFILGIPERKPIRPGDFKTRPVAHGEGDGVFNPPISPTGHPTTYYANAHIFSKRTERDETQAIGKLYKGYVDDE